MPFFRKIITVTTRHEGEVVNLTRQVATVVRESGIQEGLIHLFVRHSTAALTTIEYEPGVLSDLSRALSVLAPDDADYAHNRKWGDGNGRSHVKAALVGPCLTVPVTGGETQLRDLAADCPARTRYQCGAGQGNCLYSVRRIIARVFPAGQMLLFFLVQP